MCLVINENIHEERMSYRDYTKLPKPFITQKDIHCLKVLLKVLKRTEKGWITPFIKSSVPFNNGVATLEVEKSRKKFPFGFEYDVYGKQYLVNEGIHSLGYKNYGYIDYQCCFFEAIIPKGSIIYFGMAGDIVSDKLLVFENKKQYKEYIKDKDVFDVTKTPLLSFVQRFKGTKVSKESIVTYYE